MTVTPVIVLWVSCGLFAGEYDCSPPTPIKAECDVMVEFARSRPQAQAVSDCAPVTLIPKKEKT